MADATSPSVLKATYISSTTPEPELQLVEGGLQCRPRRSINYLEFLPGEIQNSILRYVYLDYESAFHLSATNKYFRSIVSLSQPGRDAKAAYLERVQLFPQHQLRRVCFECLTLKPAKLFIQHSRLRCSPLSRCCRCLECYARTKRSDLGHFVRVEGQGVLYCKCGKWTRRLCKQCQNCLSCISGSSTQHHCPPNFMNIPEPHPIDETFERINARVAATIPCY